ncbi:high mobility group nucleosome-binding domain-containing protein 5-like isoform X1 [Rhopilema esculentum]|uniref:high mobility group nucleosome-binding domain-containing protein 5-like isoform X1 n=1 Tax=Rhopilema esculentum TaxID=499914 RepID=UPI0031DE5072
MEYNTALCLLSLILCANCLPLEKRDEVSHCTNVYNECPEWKNAGFCEQNQDYMQATCPLTCGFCKEASVEAQEDEDQTSGEATEEGSSSGFEESSGVKKTEKGENDKDSEEKTKNEEKDKNKDQKDTNKAAEEERTENAEKYEDEEKQNDKGVKPVQQRSHEKKNLMETMLENGDLKAVSVSKAKTRGKVPVHQNKEEEGGDDEEDDVTDVDLDFKETGLEHFSGSGSEDDKMHLTLRQNFDKKYEDKGAPAFKILSGNFEKDIGEALGDDSAVTDVSFSEAEVEGNPRTTGKVRVNFNFNGDYKKLQKLVSSGSINGLLVVKNSLEGPMLNLEESE